MSATKKMILIVVFIVLALYGNSQQSESYQRAAEACRSAAAKTPCPDQRDYLLRMAAWNDCMVKTLACGGCQSCGPKLETANAPRCDENTIGGSGGSNNMSPLEKMRAKQEMAQMELTNATSAAMSAYSQAIANGKKESGALLDATLAGVSNFSNSNDQLLFTGVGLGMSLLSHLSEKKQERLAKEAEERRKEEDQIRIREYIKKYKETKQKFLTDLLNINKYAFSDLVSKERYATLLVMPSGFDTSEQAVYFTIPIQVTPHSDGTYPLKDEIHKKLISSVDKKFTSNNITYTLYPITDPETFNSDFTKKMGSGKIIRLIAEILNFTKYPFEYANFENNSEKDFWGNSTIKKSQINKKETPKTKTESQGNKKEKSFWDN